MVLILTNPGPDSSNSHGHQCDLIVLILAHILLKHLERCAFPHHVAPKLRVVRIASEFAPDIRAGTTLWLRSIGTVTNVNIGVNPFAKRNIVQLSDVGVSQRFNGANVHH